jgi:hypothetical protein
VGYLLSTMWNRWLKEKGRIASGFFFLYRDLWPLRAHLRDPIAVVSSDHFHLSLGP